MSVRVIGVIRKFLCESCGNSQNVYLNESSAATVCQCGSEMSPVVEGRPTKTAVFPYTTTHLDGQGTPIVVESLSHLRRLERQYGVVVHGFSADHSHSELKDLPRHRIGGRDYEG